MSKEIEKKVEELKEELGDKTETVVEEEKSKLHKVIGYALKGLALVATGLFGFFVGQHIGGGSNETETQEEEKTEE